MIEKNQSNPANDLYTVQEIADRYRVNEKTVYGWIRRGQVEALKIGGCVRVRLNSVNNVITRLNF
jgi:excisionase family DNA binding protein